MKNAAFDQLFVSLKDDRYFSERTAEEPAQTILLMTAIQTLKKYRKRIIII